MNDTVWTALQTHLDHAIAAVSARHGRKQQMREELFAHLLSLYEEELASLHDERAALDEAIRRFGAIDDVRCELTASVPFLERVFFLVLGKKENIMWRLFLFLGCLALFIGLGFVCPALQQILSEGAIPLAVALLIFGAAISLVGIWTFAYGIQRFRVRNS